MDKIITPMIIIYLLINFMLKKIIYFNKNITMSFFKGEINTNKIEFNDSNGLIIKNTNTADNSTAVLTLQTGETDIQADDVIGAINFQAPNEGTGTDANLVAASIEAVSEGDFSSSSNATKLSFKTGSSETAVETMKLTNKGVTISSNTEVEDNARAADNAATNTAARDSYPFIFILRTKNENGAGSGNLNGGFWGATFRKGVTTSNGNYNLDIYMKNHIDGGIHKIGVFENDNQDFGKFFTGQHGNIMNTTIDNSYVGLIVSSTGKYINANNTLQASINESLPVCIISNSDNDKKVFGVISDKEDTSDKRSTGTGSYKSISKKANINEQRMYINSVGEGAIWVCNKNGTLENGDYISSSTVPGYGVKQADDLLHNYTVAKITCDCNFSTTKIVKQKLKVISTTDADGNTTTEIDYDTNGDVQYEDDLDENGNQQMVYPLETRFLLPDGTQITEEEYNTRLGNGENVYIACFVGCTYHCG